MSGVKSFIGPEKLDHGTMESRLECGVRPLVEHTCSRAACKACVKLSYDLCFRRAQDTGMQSRKYESAHLLPGIGILPLHDLDGHQVSTLAQCILCQYHLRQYYFSMLIPRSSGDTVTLAAIPHRESATC